MKIEFNGRVVAGFLLGALCGAAATIVVAAGPIGRIQREREEARFTIEQQNTQIQQLQQRATQQNSVDPAVQVLNMVRPGLGTLAGAVAQGMKASQVKPALEEAARSPIAANPILRCGANEVAVPALGQCVACNPGLHPGVFPDGSAGCVPTAEN
jgi:hypothetical protein